jgi:hypothetical protein
MLARSSATWARSPSHLRPEAQGQRVGDRDDLHDAGFMQPLHPLPDGGLRQAHRLADGRVRPASVELKLLDDPLGDLVEHHRAGRTAARAVGHPITSFARRAAPCS